MIIFVTGIGTGIGKTVISAILTEALEADYIKPVQAGYAEGTDTEWVASRIQNKRSRILPEIYKLKLAASPHIAAREENIEISIKKICDAIPANSSNLIMEGAGGLLVPLNQNEFVADLIRAIDAKVILVSRNYLGSINHSLLTASVCKEKNLPVLGWIFNDHYLNYEEEIVKWSGFPRIASVPFVKDPNRGFIKDKADGIKEQLLQLLC